MWKNYLLNVRKVFINRLYKKIILNSTKLFLPYPQLKLKII